jgi:hypothetical protein
MARTARRQGKKNQLKRDGQILTARVRDFTAAVHCSPYNSPVSTSMEPQQPPELPRGGVINADDNRGVGGRL